MYKYYINRYKYTILNKKDDNYYSIGDNIFKTAIYSFANLLILKFTIIIYSDSSIMLLKLLFIYCI